MACIISVRKRLEKEIEKRTDHVLTKNYRIAYKLEHKLRKEYGGKVVSFQMVGDYMERSIHIPDQVVDRYHKEEEKLQRELQKAYVKELKNYEENTRPNTVDNPYFDNYFKDGNTELTVREVLNKIAEANHPLNELAKTLTGYIKYNTKIKLVDHTEMPVLDNNPNRIVNGVHQYQSEILINKQTTNPVENLLLHEILHNMTVYYLENSKSSKLYKDLDSLYQYAKNNIKEDHYGLKDIKEFAVEVFADGKFASALQKVAPMEGATQYENLFEQLLDYLLQLFGLSKENETFYNQVVSTVSQVVKENHRITDQIFAENQVQDLTFEEISQGFPENYSSTAPIKEGVQELFKSNPELANVGSQEQYSQYLDTIFPDSKVKDIVYHGTDNAGKILEQGFKHNAELFEADDDRAYESGELGYGYYFTNTKESAKNFGDPLAVILNNPDITNETTFNLITNEKGIQHFVKTKEQIHILGSKQDIEGFREFVGNNTQTTKSPQQTEAELISEAKKLAKNSVKRDGDTLQVFAENGVQSNLYQEILQRLSPEHRLNEFGEKLRQAGIIKDNSYSETALALWIEAQMPENLINKGDWKNNPGEFSEVLDSNNEPSASFIYPELTSRDPNRYVENDRAVDVPQALKDFFESFGISVKQVNEILDSKGMAIDAYFKMDAYNRILEIAQGTEGISLSEEAAHLAIILLRGTKLYNRAINYLVNDPMFEQVAELYANEYAKSADPDVVNEKVLEEVFAKRIAEELDNRIQNPQETSERSWFGHLVDAIVNWFNSVFFDNPSLRRDFQEVARMIHQQDYADMNPENLDQATQEDYFYKKIEHNPILQQEVLESIQETQDKFEQMDENGRYVIDGMTYRFRVTEIKDMRRKRYYSQIERKASEAYKEWAATKGTVIHSYFQHIIDAYSEGATYTRKQILDKVREDNKDLSLEHNKLANREELYLLNEADYKLVEQAAKEIVDEIRQNDPNAIFLTEMKVADPRDFDKTFAGTVDLLVIHGDGSVSIYDFKTTSFKKNAVHGYFYPIHHQQIKDYDEQVGLYKDILSQVYNVKKFRRTRIVPVHIAHNFNRKTNTLLGGIPTEVYAFTKTPPHKLHKALEEMGIRDLTQHVAVAHEQSDYSGVQKQIERLRTRKTLLEKDLESAVSVQKKGIIAQIQNIEKSIQSILVDNDIRTLIANMAHVINDAYKRLENPGNRNLKDFVDIKNYLEMHLDFLADFQEYFKDQTEELGENPLTKLNEEFNGWFEQLNLTYANVEHRIVEILNEEANKNLIEGAKKEGMFQRAFQGMSRQNNPIFHRAAELLSESEFAKVKELNKIRTRVIDNHKEFVKWGKKKGLTGYSLYQYIITEDKNLAPKFRKEFFDDKKRFEQQLLANKKGSKEYNEALAWLKTHKEFNQELFDRDRERFKNYLESSPDVTKKSLEENLAEFDLDNPALNERAYGQRSIYWKLDSAEETKYASDLWNEARRPGNEGLRNYLDMYYSMNNDFAHIIGFDNVGYNSILNVKKDLMDEISETGFTNMKSFPDRLKAILHAEDSNFSVQLIDDAGNPVESIPIPKTKTPTARLSTAEKQRIRKELIAENLHPENSPEFLKELDKRLFLKSKEKGVDQKSIHLTNSLLIMADLVYNYKFMSEVKDEILALQWVLENKYQEIHTGKRDEVITDPATKEWQKTTAGATQATVDNFAKLIKARLYNKQNQDKEIVTEIQRNQEGDTFNLSVTKAIRALSNYHSVMALGLAPIMGFANWSNARINLNILGKEGIYFTNKVWKDSLKSIGKADPKAMAGIALFELTQRDFQREAGMKASPDLLRRVINQTAFFILHAEGDQNVDNNLIVSMLKHAVWDSDNKIKFKGSLTNRAEYYRKQSELSRTTDPKKKAELAQWLQENPEPKSLYDLIIEKEDGSWELDINNYLQEQGKEALDEKQIFKELTRFRRIAFDLSNQIKGTISPENISAVNTNLLTQQLMKFRTWMPGMIWSRFHGTRINPNSLELEVGRFTVGYSEIIKQSGFVPKAKSFIKLMTEAITLGLYKAKPDYRVAEAILNKFKKENKGNDHLNVHDFLELRRKKIAGLAREIGILTWFFMLVQALRGIGWDDVDDDTNFAEYFIRRNSFNALRRTYLEISFFFNPISFLEIAKTPVPMLRLLDQFIRATTNGLEETSKLIRGVEDPRDRTPFFHHSSKLVPGLNQALRMSGYFETPSSRTTFERIFGIEIGGGEGLFRPGN